MPLQQLAQAATEGAASSGEAAASPIPFPPFAPEVLFRLGPLGVTNTILYTYLVMVVLVFLAAWATRRLQEVPAAPFYLQEGNERIPLFRAVAADWSTTLALALVTFVVTEFWAFRYRAKEHLMHFVKPLGIGQIELVSEFVRLLSLSLRLFGNLFAGEVLITDMTSLTYLVIPAVFLVLETLFGFIQATVFTILCLAYFTLNTTSHHVEHDEAENPLHATAA